MATSLAVQHMALRRTALRHAFPGLLLFLAASSRGIAQAAPGDTSLRVSFGAFVDTYYAWDTGRPPSFDRSFAGGGLFTTQPARHNEFNVNLAFVEAVVRGPRVRGRLALHAGTSVQSNYAGEATTGDISGPSLARHIQEAVVGYRVADDLWIDAGIFFSNVGMESWISRDNPAYTRSLAADYSPYFSSGAKLTWAASPKLTARLDVVNGWQNIAENNAGKAAGLRVDYAARDGVTMSYYNLVSQEAGTKLRTFNGVGARLTNEQWLLLAEADVGTQSRGRGAGTSSWVNTALIARYQATAHVGVSGRAEYTSDPDQVVINTGSFADGRVQNAAFQATGGSFGVDVQPDTRVQWRTEVRGWRSRDPVFATGRTGAPSRTGAFVVTSLAMSF